MTIAVETYLVVAMAFAIFAAVVALGSSLVLGIGFERLRAGYEVIRKQTGFFSEAIRTLDGRVDSVEKQSQYFFETIHQLEEKQDRQAPAASGKGDTSDLQEDTAPQYLSIDAGGDDQKPVSLWAENTGENTVRFH